MFTIIGGDGKEYGPATEGKIREWIIGGRANLQTRARREGETEWKTLGAYAEFAAQVAAAPAVPPPLPALAAAAAPAVAASTDELADRGVRLVAFIIDRLIAMVFAFPGMLFLGAAFLRAVVEASRGGQPDFSGMNQGRLLLGVLLLGSLSCVLLIVQVSLLSLRGQTLGKMMMGIRVVRCDDGAPAGFVHAWLLRNLVPSLIEILPWIGFAFFVVDACFIFNEQRRCVHDFIADTKVVKVINPP